MPGIFNSIFTKITTMKTIKYIIITIVILSMTLGSFSNLSGQENILFAETYNQSEVTSSLEKNDLFFTLVSSDDADKTSLGTCLDADINKLWKHLNSNKTRKHFPEDLFFAWGWNSENGSATLYALKRSSEEVPGKDDLQSLSVEKSNRTASYDLLISLSDEGAEKWASMTKNNVGSSIAIIVDDRVVAAPMVREEIKFGKCKISGSYTKEEMTEIKVLLEK